MTARGLVDRLAENSTGIHFFEDIETLLDERRSWGVRRSALWSQSKQKPMLRWIKWDAHETKIAIPFTGSIVMIANRNLAEGPELDGVRSRINVMEHKLEPDEIIAFMKRICLEGYKFQRPDKNWVLTKVEAWEVMEFIVNELSSMQRPLDLRILIHGFHDRIHTKYKLSKQDWQEQLLGRMQAKTTIIKTRHETKIDEAKLAQEIYQRKDLTKAQKAELFAKETQLSVASYYRALKRKQ